MRKLIVLSFITLDGVMQAPGGPEEDASGGFKFGGWSAPYWDDVLAGAMTDQMGHPADLLLGRKTYEIFASYWPHAGEDDPAARAINTATKYVVSHRPVSSDWKPTISISGDIPEKIRELKNGDGPELQVHGSGNLIQTLLEHDLVDEFWLKTYPLVLGSGRRLFAGGTQPAGLKLIKSEVSPAGVVITSYARAGEVKLGSF